MALPPVTLDAQLNADLICIKSLPALRLGLYLVTKITETELNLSILFGKNSKTVRKIGQKLVDMKIIEMVIADGDVWYHLNKRYFDIESTCRNCKFKNETSVGESTMIICDKKGKTCAHRHRLIGYNIGQSMKNHKPAIYESYDRKIEKREIRHVDQWDYKDYITLCFEKFKENYPNLIAQESHEVRKNVKQLIKIFRENVKENWRRILKQYILEMFKEYKNLNKVVTFYSLINKKDISKFLASYGKKIKKVEYCEIKGLNCSFCVGQKCQLQGGHETCTSSITSKMQEKYN